MHNENCTVVGMGAAACHEGLKGGLGTKESYCAMETTKGTFNLVATIDGCPLGVLGGSLAGHSRFEVSDGVFTVSAEDGDTTYTDSSCNSTESEASEEDPECRCVMRELTTYENGGRSSVCHVK